MENRDVLEAVKYMRSLVESKDADSAEVKHKVSKIEEALDKQEKENQKIVAELKAKEKLVTELKESFEEAEKRYARMPRAEFKNPETSLEIKAFEKALRHGKESLTSEEVKYLRTDHGPEGGFLAPPEYIQEIIKGIIETSPIRQLARVRTTTRDAIEIPRRTSIPTGQWVGEGGPIGEDQSSYGINQIKVNKLAVATVITTEMLTDSCFNMESEINQDIIQAFAKAEGQAFLNGNGVAKPEGIMVNEEVETINTGVANDITADAIIGMTGQLIFGYNPVYMLNRRTLARIRQLKAGDGHYLWQPGPGLASGIPNTINGFPYLSAIDMDDIAPNSYPIAFGDLGKAYTIVDHTSLTMLRDPYSLGRQGKIQFISQRRVGGQVVLPEAMKKLKVSV